ncbi:HvfC/BufC N-terminal domain-containing protein [Nitrospira sp. Kam-Ns4a]
MVTMPRLPEVQQAFYDAVVRGAYHAVTGGIAPGRSALRSIALYRRLIRDNYTQVLKVTYPVLCRLVGERYFGILARGYFKVHPSTSGDLFPYGLHFPTFLKELQATPQLVELARLEWACHEVHQAADAPLLSAAQLLAMASQDPSHVIVRLHAAVRLLRFRFPVHRIWLALQPDVPESAANLPLEEEATGVVVTRRDGHVRVTPLAILDFILLEAMASGQSLTAIVRMAIACQPKFDLAGFFAEALNLRVIRDFSVVESP